MTAKNITGRRVIFAAVIFAAVLFCAGGAFAEAEDTVSVVSSDGSLEIKNMRLRDEVDSLQAVLRAEKIKPTGRFSLKFGINSNNQIEKNGFYVFYGFDISAFLDFKNDYTAYIGMFTFNDFRGGMGKRIVFSNGFSVTPLLGMHIGRESYRVWDGMYSVWNENENTVRYYDKYRNEYSTVLGAHASAELNFNQRRSGLYLVGGIKYNYIVKIDESEFYAPTIGFGYRWRFAARK